LQFGRPCLNGVCHQLFADPWIGLPSLLRH
jgi:hypothetical protein